MTDKRTWSWRHAVKDSDLEAPTKHILKTISFYMNELGEGAYPSIAQLCADCSLTKSTVIKHIKLAEDAGYLERRLHGFKGPQWRRTEYLPIWPERRLLACAYAHGAPKNDGGEGDAPPDEVEETESETATVSTTSNGVPENEKGGTPKRPRARKRGAGNEPTRSMRNTDAVNESDQHIESIPDSSNSFQNAGVGAHPEHGEAPEDEKALRKRFDRFFEKLPQKARVTSNRDAAFSAFLKLEADDREKAVDRVGRYYELVQKSGRDYLKALSKVLSEKLFLEVDDEPEPTADEIVHVKPYSKAWHGLRWKIVEAGRGRVFVPGEDFAAFTMDWSPERKRRFVMAYEWKHLLDFDDASRDRFAEKIIKRREELTEFDGFQFLKIESDEWAAWLDWYDRTATPVPPLGNLEHVFVPNLRPPESRVPDGSPVAPVPPETMDEVLDDFQKAEGWS